MTIPSPRDLGLPSKFIEWRPGQWKAINDGLESSKRVVVQVQRGGRGKTLTYMTQAALLKGDRVVILTPNKGLQDQLMEEWGDYGLRDIRGKSSYDCDGLVGSTCDDGTIGKCMYKGTSMCGWGGAVREVKEARIVVSNYTCFISSYKYGQGFGKFDTMICDEAHSAPSEVAKAMRVQLTDREMDSIKRKWPETGILTTMADWKHWAAVTGVLADNELQRLKLAIDKPGTPSAAAIRAFKHAKNLVRKLADIATCRPERWVCDEWLYGYQFDTIDSRAAAEKLLFREIPRVILTSGTIRPKTLEQLGFVRGDYEFFDYPSEIQPDRSPLIHVTTGVKVNRGTQEWEFKKLVRFIDRIVEGRPDRKGIIHTANFRLRDFIMAHSKYASCFVTNYVKDEKTTDVIARFKAMRAPAVLVSPSVTTGYDFPYDMCRYQIIAKLPYDDISTKIEQARTALDPENSAYKMMQALSQAFSRGDRGDDDWQEVFVLDDNIGFAMWKYGHLAPAWLPAYFRVLDRVPEPLMEVA